MAAPYQRGKGRTSNFLLEELETRVLFAADLPVALLGMPLGADTFQASVVSDLNTEAKSESLDLAVADVAADAISELVIIDAGVANVDTMLADLQSGSGAGLQVVVLEQVSSDATDALEQLSEVLARYQELQAVHLVSHGASGELILGGQRVQTLDLVSNTSMIDKWQDSLAPGADFLVYGCDLASGVDGAAFVETLSLLSGADVAASTDLTGAVKQGGDWTFEYHIGDIRHSVVFSQDLQHYYNESLARSSGNAWVSEAGIARLHAGDAETWYDSTNASFSHPAVFHDSNQSTPVIDVDDTVGARREILFVSSQVVNYQQLLVGIRSDVEVHLLDPERDGVEQMVAALAGRTGIDAVHLVGEGTEAQMHFGSDFLTEDSISAKYAEQFRRIGLSLSEDADLLIYGCNFGQGVAGQSVLQTLSALTGADVAASDDRTGHVSESADWQLEVNTGSIETEVFVGKSAAATWNHALATYTVSNINDSGAGSLRQAILDANANPGTDTVTFNIPGSGTQIINIGSTLTITDTLVIDGTTQAGWSAGSFIPVVVDGNNGAYEGLTLTNNADGSTLRGLVVRDTGSSGIRIEAGSADNIITGNFIGSFNSDGTAAGGEELGASAIFNLGEDITIGGATAIERNVLAGAVNGIVFDAATNGTISGNYIGTNATGNATVGMTFDGIRLANGTTGVTIGGSGAGSGNVIAGSGSEAIQIESESADSNIIRGNSIGLAADGTTILGNERGILILGGPDNTVLGGAGSGNVILGSASTGIEIDGASTGTIIYGNSIGINDSQTVVGGSGQDGILLQNGAANTSIGATAAGQGNVITDSGRASTSFNAGINIDTGAGTGNRIAGNSIYANGGTGINLGAQGVNLNDAGDADSGANNLQNWAILHAVSIADDGTFAYRLDTTTLAAGTYTVDFYASTDRDRGEVEGRRYLGTVTGVANGNIALTGSLPGIALAVGEYVTLVTTDASGNSSEFSNYAVAVDGDTGGSVPSDLHAVSTNFGGFSLNEDGGDDVYLEVDNGASILSGLSDLTVEFQFAAQPVANGTQQSILSYATPTNSDALGLFAYKSADGLTQGLGIDIDGVSTLVSVSLDAIFDGTRHALSLTWSNSSGNWQVFSDGVLIASGTALATGQTIDGGGKLVFGQDLDSGANHYQFSTDSAFKGKLYEARVFNNVRTAGEIAAMYRSDLPFDETGMIGNWRFSDLSSDGITTDTVAANNLIVKHVTQSGFTASQPRLGFQIDENALNNTVLGTVAGLDADREAQIAQLLASDATLRYSQDSDKFFRIKEGIYTWSVALADASNSAIPESVLNGVTGQLGTIRTAAEQSIVAELAATFNMNIMVAGSDQGDEGDWRWYSAGVAEDAFWNGNENGLPVNASFNNFGVSEPNNLGGNEHFLAVRVNGEWTDESGTFAAAYVSEWNADTILTSTDALSYSITSQTVDGAFAIDSNTGDISVANGILLDYESHSSHLLNVLVTDATGNSDAEAFTVDLVDLLESNNAPTALSTGIELNTDGGNDAYLIADDGGAILGGLTEVTVEIAFQLNELSSTPLLSYAGTSENDLLVLLRADGRVFIGLAGGSTFTSEMDYRTLADGEKHHFALTWDNASGAWGVYVDGKLTDSGTGLAVGRAIAGSAGTGELVIGQEQDSVGGGFESYQFIDGAVYDVRIWDEVRSEAEISVNHQKKFDSSNLPGGLVANWQMDGFNGSNEVVDVVSGNNLNVANVRGTVLNNWSNTVGGVSATGDTITFVDEGQSGWSSSVNSAAFASMGFTDNYTVSFTLDNLTNFGFYIGLGLNETDAGFGDVEHAINFDHSAGTSVMSYQNGGNGLVHSVNYSAGDEFSFYVNGSTIEYQHNGVTFHTETGVTPAANWYLDSSFRAESSGAYANQEDYSLSGLRVRDGNAATPFGFKSSTPVEDLHIPESAADGSSVGFVLPHDPDVINDVVEDGLFTGSPDPTNFALFTSGQSVGGWSIAGAGDVYLHNADGVYQDETPLGGNTIHLPAGSNSAIEQTLATEAGRQYQIVFAGSGLWDTAGVKRLQVSADGETADFLYEQAPPNYDFANSMVWEHGAMTFTATDSSTVLRFEDVSGYSGQGTLISDVQVIEIPAAVSVILNSDSTLSYDAATGKFYRVTGTTATATDALILADTSTINGISGKLVTIRSEYENELVGNMAAFNLNWIGASDATVEGEWHWLNGNLRDDQFSSGSTALPGYYANWASGQPDTTAVANNAFIDRRDGEWGDVVGSSILGVVMEWDASEVLSNFTFSLVNDAGGRFAIDNNTGEVTVTDGLLIDYETAVSHDIDVLVTDATGNSHTESLTIAVDNRLDANQTVPGAQVIDEETVLRLSSGNLNALSVSDSFADTDTPLQVTLNVNDGVLTLNPLTMAGITIVDGADGSSSVTISGSESQLNAVLEGLEYLPDFHFNGSATLHMTTALAADLQGHYTFEGGNADNQSVGTTWHGVFNGDATTVIDAQRGEVLHLDGTDDNVEIASLFDEPANVTLSAWVNIDDYDTQGSLVISVGETVKIWLDRFGFGRVTGEFNNGSGPQQTFVAGLAPELLGTGWHHIAYVFNDVIDSQVLYLDGLAIAQTNLTDSIVYANEPVTRIGGHAGNETTRDFDGLIDDARIYSRALSADEIVALTLHQHEAVDTVAITVNPVNDAPTFISLDNTPTYIEGDAAVVLDPDVSILDQELSTADDFGGATLTLSRALAASTEDLFSATGNLVFNMGTLELSAANVGSYTNTAGTLTLTLGSGVTNAQVNEIMQSIAYANASDSPPSSVQINWSFDDGNVGAQGDGGALTASGSTLVTVIDTDEPAFLSVPIAQSVNEDVPLTFSSAGGNAIVVESGSLNDPVVTVNLSVSNGSLKLATTTGIAFLAGTGNGDAVLTIAGKEAAINSALDGMQYLGGQDYNGSDTLILTTGSSTTAEANLYARYEFLNGSTEDYSGNGLDGVTSGDPVLTNDVERGDVMSFDGDDLIRIANGTAGLGNQLTIAAWIDLDAGQNENVFLSLGDEVYVVLDPTSSTFGIGGRVDNFTSYSFGSSNRVAGTGWHHVALTLDTDTNTMEIFLDGELLRSTTNATWTPGWGTAASPDITIGALSDGSRAFVGSVDDIRIYDSAFTQAEIIGIMGDNGFDTEAVAILINAINDAPVVSAIELAAIGYTENDSPTPLTSTLAISDADDSNIESAVVRLTGNYVDGEDVLSFTDQNGITGTWATGTGTLSLSGSATLADYEAALHSITYENLSDDPSVSTRTVSFTINDGATNSNTQTRSIAITAVNDAPVISAVEVSVISYAENDSPTTITSTLAIADADDANIESAVVQITGNYVDGEDVLSFADQNGITGTWTASTGTLSLSGSATLADYRAALRLITYANLRDDPSVATRTVSFTINDGATNSNTETRSIAITAENDAPVVSTIEVSAINYTENDSPKTITSTLAISDADDSNIQSAVVQITGNYVDGEDVLSFTDQNGITGTWTTGTGTLSLSGSATLANYQAALHSITYENLSNDPSVATRTVSITINDGATNSNTETRSIAITAVNDAPAISAVEVSAINYTENDSAVVVTSTLAIDDADDANIESAVVQITGNYVDGEDILSFTDQNGITGTWTTGTGTLSLSGSATLANYQAALRSITYENLSDDPSVSTRTVSFTINDGATNSNTETRSIAITAVNDAPVISAIAGTAIYYTENDGPGPITTTLAISDEDDTHIESAVIQIMGNYVDGEDYLLFVDQNGIAGNWTASTGTLMLSGSATRANYEAALRSIAYENTSENPSVASRTLTFTVNDGELNSNVPARSIDITAMNDAPVLVNNALTIAEGGSVILDAANLSSTDVDNDTGTLIFTISSISGGQFERVAAPSVVITSFTQQQVTDGDIRFVHDGGETPPLYLVTVSDSSLNDGPSAVGITFSNINDAPAFNAGNASVFDSHAITTDADGASSVTTADIDGDGDVDVLSASFFDDQIVWYENDSSENFTPQLIAADADGAQSVVAVDLDGDGDVDVLSASQLDDRLVWYANDGSENFTAYDIATDVDGARAVTSVDVDGDGDMDVLSASRFDNRIVWYENDGTQSFTFHTIANNATNARSVATADVDGDGDVDVLSASSSDDRIVWYENDGSEIFTAHDIAADADGARSVTAADVDGDGDVDVLSASFGDDRVVWYENDGSQNFTTRTIASDVDGAYSVTTADVDSDGDLDVLATAYSGNQLLWYENDGSENFNAHIIEENVLRAQWVATADVDSDGDLDVLSASRNDDPIAWYENSLSTLDNKPLFIENGPAVLLDDTVSVSDAELDALNSGNGNYAGARLTVTRTGLENSDDVFGFVDGNGLTLVGGNLIKNGLSVAVFDTGSNPGQLIVTFNDAGGVIPTTVDLANVASQISYANINDTPPASIQLDWLLVDGNTGGQGSGGAGQVSGSTTVNITATNDSPVISGIEVAEINYTENDGAVAITSTLAVSDVDDATIDSAVVRITGNYADGEDVLSFVNQNGITGTWTAGTGTLSLTGAATLADYQTALRSITYENTSDDPSVATRTVSFTINDGDADSNTQTRSIAITAVNDAPVIAAVELAAINYTENDGAVPITSSLAISDVDNTNLDSALVRITSNYVDGEDVLSFVDQNGITGTWTASTGTLSLSGSATLAAYEAALRSVTYENLSDNPSAAPRTISFTINDGNSDSNTQTRSIAVSAVNNAPVVSAVEVAAINYLENDGAVTITSTLAVADADDTNIESAVVQIIGAYVDGEDVLSFIDQNGITGVWTASTGILSLTGSATLGDYQTALRSITYENVSDDPSAATRTVNFTINDGDVNSNSQTRLIAIAAVNDEPVVQGVEVAAINYTENDGPTPITSALTIADVDDTNVVSALVQITDNYVNGEDVLSFVDQNGIVGTWTASTGSMSLSGAATVADYQTALRTLTYENSSDHLSGATRTVSFTVSDGDLDSNTQTRSITVAAVNDAPVISTVEFATINVTENDGAVAITSTLVVSDVDEPNIESATVRISNNYVDGEDVVSFVDQNGITGTWTASTGTLSLSGSATLADYEAALRSITFENISEAPSVATRSVSFTISDGDATSNTQTRFIAVAAVNDSPVISGIEVAEINYTENDGAVAITSTLAVSDVDDATIDSAVVRVTGNYADGEDVLSFVNQNGITGTWTAGTGTLSLTGSATLANYQTALRSITYENTSDDPSVATRTVSFTINDGDADSNTQTRSIAITAVNDAPVIAAVELATINYTENDGAVPITSSLAISDLDNTNLDSALVRITSNYVDGEDVLSFVDQNGITGTWTASTGTLSLSGSATLADYEAALRSVTFENLSDDLSVATRTVSFTINDGDADSNTQTRTIAIAAINDAPVVSAVELAVVSYTENDGSTPVTSTLVLSDADDVSVGSALVQITGNYVDGEDVLSYVDQNGITGTWTASTGTLSLSGSATLADYEAALRSITFENISEAPSVATRSVSFTISDGDANSNTQTRSIAIAAVNDSPVISGIEVAEINYTENDGAVAITSTLAVSDVDDATIDSAVVRITGNYADGEDVLSFVNQNGITGTWTAGTGTLSLTGAATLADYQTALRSIIYENISDDPSVTTRTVSFTINDGDADSNTQTRLIDVSAVNDAPTLITISNSHISENTDTSAGVSVGILQTIDAESGENYTYNVIGGIDSAAFRIGGVNSDELILTDGILDFELKQNYSVVLRTTDSGGLTHDEALVISVTNVNEAPVISSAPDVTVPENQMTAINIIASDVDGDTISYSISGGIDAARFTLDESSGELTFVEVPDHESQDYLEVQITVSDSDALTDTQLLGVSISDVNEAPAIMDIEFDVEAGFEGTVGQVTAVDPDSGDVLVFSLIPGETLQGQSRISLSETGSLSADGPDAGLYQFVVRVVDSQGLGASAMLTLRVESVELGAANPESTPFMLDLTSNDGKLADNPTISLPVFSASTNSRTDLIAIGEPEFNTVILRLQTDGEQAEVSELSRFSGALLEPTSEISTNSNSVAGFAEAVDSQTPESIATIESTLRALLIELLTNASRDLVDPLTSTLGGSVKPVSISIELIDQLDLIRSGAEILQAEYVLRSTATATAGVVITATLSVGFATWLMQSGLLMASALSTAPLWRSMDPMPILIAGSGSREGDESRVPLAEDPEAGSVSQRRRTHGDS